MSCGLKLLAQCLALKIFKSTEGGESEMISFPSCQSALGECEMIISGLNVVSSYFSQFKVNCEITRLGKEENCILQP